MEDEESKKINDEEEEQEEQEEQEKEEEKDVNTPLRMVKKFENLFTEYDKNGDGLIDYGEWNDLIHQSDETSLSHLNENDAHMLFAILSKNTGLIKYPELLQDLTLAAQQHPTMAPNEFINSFFARFVAMKERSASVATIATTRTSSDSILGRQKSLNSPIVGTGSGSSGNFASMMMGASSRALLVEGANEIEALQKKYEQIKQKLKDKEIEWAEEKLNMEATVERLELVNAQLKRDNEEMEQELTKLKNLEVEHYMNREDKNVLKEQMIEMEDDIRRVQEELERVNSLNFHLKQQGDLYNEQKQKLMDENRTLLNEKQDLVHESKLNDLKLETTRSKFEEMCEKYQQLQLQMEEMEQTYKQQLRQMELQLLEQQLDANIATASMKPQTNPNINNNVTRYRSGTVHTAASTGSGHPIDMDISPRDSFEPSLHRGYTASLGGKSNSQYPLDLSAVTPQRKMTNQDLFEFYKEHHRKNSLSAAPPPLKHIKNDSVALLNIDEQKVDENRGNNTTQIDRDWPQTVETIVKEQTNGLKQMIQSEFGQMTRDLVNSTAFRQNLNHNDEIGQANTKPSSTGTSQNNGDIDQALQGVEKLLDQKLQQLVLQLLEKESQSNTLIKLLQDQIEEYKSTIAQMNATNIHNNNSNSSNNNNNTTATTTTTESSLLSPQQMSQLLSYVEKSEQNMQGLTREVNRFLEEMRSREEKNNNSMSNKPKNDSSNTTTTTPMNEAVTQMALNVKESLQGISQHLEQLKAENLEIRGESDRVKEQNRDLIRSLKDLTTEKDELAENKRAMMRKLNGEMDTLRKEITQIKQQQQMEMELNDSKSDKPRWLGGMFHSWLSL